MSSFSPEPTAVPFHIFNVSRSYCNISTCSIDVIEADKRDAITGVRVLFSLLSITGSLSIIVSVVWRKIASSPKIHPIFVLSVADTLLGLSWVLGGVFWFTGISHRSWCFLPSLLTVILQCVSVVLTVVYALVAYRVLKKQQISDVLTGGSVTVRAWARRKMAVVYILAWLIPSLAVLIIFGAVASKFSLVDKAEECSCWCLPYFINIVPVAFPDHEATAEYYYHIRVLILSTSVMLVTVYFTGFSTLIYIYWKILRYIRQLRDSAKPPSSPSSYGTIGEVLTKGHSQAKKRVLWFLSAFIITGIANVILCSIFVVIEVMDIRNGEKIKSYNKNPHDHLQAWHIVAIYLLQSVTAPLQGFLNALVYGWTRDNFIRTGDSPRVGRGGGGGGGGGRRKRLSASISSDGCTSGIINSASHDPLDTGGGPFLHPPPPHPPSSLRNSGVSGSTRLSDSGKRRLTRNTDRDANSAIM